MKTHQLQKAQTEQTQALYRNMLDKEHILLFAATCNPADAMGTVSLVKSAIIDKKTCAAALRKIAEGLENDTDNKTVLL